MSDQTTSSHDTAPAAAHQQPDTALQVEDHGDTGVFDAFHPPTDAMISDCVHCGFCLPACPTYTLWGEEMDSPRGRIYLMKAGREGTVEMDETFTGHFDACLGCMACVSACPSGVKYDQLLEAVRPQIERNYSRDRSDRLFRAAIFSLFPYPNRLRAAAVLGTLYQRSLRKPLHRSGLLEKLPGRLRALEALLPPMALRDIRTRLDEHTPAVGATRHRVAMLTGCAQQVFFSEVNAATARVLAAEGCDVLAPADQTCCGALSVHAGREPEALERARALIDRFLALEIDSIVVNVAGCGSTMKDYGALLRDDPQYAEKAARFSAKVRDINELLDELGSVAARHPIPGRVAYHDACHLSHAQQIRSQPRAVLGTIPQLQVLNIPETDLCCGSAGIYNLVQPEPAEELGRRKVANIVSVEPDMIATANPGCLLQIRRYLDPAVKLYHPVQLVDFSIRGINPLAP
ncbi:heterodisulfide reductase-related iron-sulfur binding cluster [Allobranchiibius sp. GilTou38]|uniref:heterodisulfide reductase-related iron-sulfur binding cluster n=1 Tax=Allobranchiibius sp. GilTou38 TaxID=2815210 RepID=UPI001AA11A2E|nr:heterodisulfide reductase-related iron-sulfur binding cluster [Allobranchiibius sp. GilTou38]MBO1767274.1 4Fe-4S dicluster domain-containing protein [Allobranchiibius sp. GilTou38]